MEEIRLVVVVTLLSKEPKISSIVGVEDREGQLVYRCLVSGGSGRGTILSAAANLTGS
jgi:hypothetical protein